MPLEFQSNEPPHVLGIPVDVTPPSPSEFRDAARGIGMVFFWNHPIMIWHSVFYDYNIIYYREQMINNAS